MLCMVCAHVEWSNRCGVFKCVCDEYVHTLLGANTENSAVLESVL